MGIWKQTLESVILHIRSEMIAALKCNFMGGVFAFFSAILYSQIVRVESLCLNSSQLSHQSEHRHGCESYCGNFQHGDRSNSTFLCLRREQQRKPGTPECAGVFHVG